LPYFTDVAYYADQTPTHDAQEASKVEGKAEADFKKISLPVADVQSDSAVGHNLPSQKIHKRIPYLTSRAPSSHHPFLALLISRPPPLG
jgi:tagatose-1,6-bisphosphate aldolase